MTRTTSYHVRGVHGYAVGVEVDKTDGASTIEGMPERSARECVIRVSAALRSRQGYQGGFKARVWSDAPVISSGYHNVDLAILACVILACPDLPNHPDDFVVAGELTVGGMLRPTVRGVVAGAELSKLLGKRLVIPVCNLPETRLVDDRALGISTWTDLKSLADVVDVFPGAVQVPLKTTSPRGGACITHDPIQALDGFTQEHRDSVLSATRRGQNVLLVGFLTPTTRAMAKDVVDALGPMTDDERVEVARIHGAVGLLAGEVPTSRPFRGPHHSITGSALVGTVQLPGEVTLAHHGVLYLEDVEEIRRAGIKELARVVSNGTVSHGFDARRVTMPARPRVVMSARSCPCGWLGTSRACACSAASLGRWRKRVYELAEWFDACVVTRALAEADS